MRSEFKNEVLTIYPEGNIDSKLENIEKKEESITNKERNINNKQQEMEKYVLQWVGFLLAEFMEHD